MRRIQSIANLASASADQRAPYAAKRLLELFPDALLGVSNQNNAIYDEPHEETGQFVVELQRAVLRVIFRDTFKKTETIRISMSERSIRIETATLRLNLEDDYFDLERFSKRQHSGTVGTEALSGSMELEVALDALSSDIATTDSSREEIFQIPLWQISKNPYDLPYFNKPEWAF